MGWNRVQGVPQLAMHPRRKRLDQISRRVFGFRGRIEAERERGVSDQPLYADQIVALRPDETGNSPPQVLTMFSAGLQLWGVFFLHLWIEKVTVIIPALTIHLQRLL